MSEIITRYLVGSVRNDLTEPSLFATISLEAMKARDERIALAAAKLED